MSTQNDLTERQFDQAVEAILGPPEGSDSDLLRPIKRENIRRYVAGLLSAFATGGRAAAAAQMRDAQTRLEDGIAHLPVGHPDREKPAARIAELKAQLADLDVQPIDCSGISIDTLVYRPAHRDLSTAEQPAEADRTGQSAEPTDDQVADGSQLEEKQPLVSVASAAGPSIPASVPEPVGGENEHAEVGSEPKRIEKVLSGNTALQRDIALLRRADGTLYESVDFPTAETYADISPRRRQQLMKDDGPLKVVGKGRKRRITVESLIAYCPPAEDAK